MMQQPDAQRLSINTATVRKQWTLDQIIEGCARHQIRGISPWRDQVQALGLQKTAQLIRSNELAVSGYCRGGMFPGIDEAARRAADDDNRRAVDEALALNAACLVLVVGGLPGESKDIAGARSQVRDGLGRLLEYSRKAGKNELSKMPDWPFSRPKSLAISPIADETVMRSTEYIMYPRPHSTDTSTIFFVSVCIIPSTNLISVTRNQIPLNSD